MAAGRRARCSDVQTDYAPWCSFLYVSVPRPGARSAAAKRQGRSPARRGGPPPKLLARKLSYESVPDRNQAFSYSRARRYTTQPALPHGSPLIARDPLIMSITQDSVATLHYTLKDD